MSNPKPITIKRAIDFDIMGENILDIADFAVEKYEFRNDTKLTAEVREAATTAIREALWSRLEELKRKRKQVLVGMFELADETAKRVAESA